MKKILAIALTLMFIFTLAGCGDQPAENQPVETPAPAYDWGLDLSVKDVTPTGVTLVISQSGGSPSGTLEYGSDYKIQTLDGDTWRDVPYATDENVAWTGEAYMVEMEADSEIRLSWDWLYGSLSAGQYRIVKQFMDFRDTGDYDTDNYYVSFEIK